MSIVKTKSFELDVYEKGDPNAEKLALVLPGRLDTKDYAHMTSLVDRLAEEGYFAVSFDPPGTWGSGEDINQYTTKNYLKAIQELIELYGRKPTLTIGHSRGGSMALLAAVKCDEVISCVAIMSNYAASSPKLESIETGFEDSARDLAPGTERTAQKKRFKLPISYFEDGDMFDLKELAACTKPKLFFWGNQDQILGKDQILRGFNAASEPKKLIELNTEHDYRLHSDVGELVNNNVIKFLKEYN